MKVESKIKRKGGSHVDMGDGTEYHFKPEDGRHESPHVALVPVKAHLKRLLSIEGYDLFEPDAEPAPEPAPVPNRVPVPDPTPQPQPAPEPAPMPLAHMTETDLRALYEAELGKKPHHRAGVEKLIEEIEAHRAADTQE